jgi:hypothetical protein
MGLKKYEIITVGSDKRVRALRSWRVQDRYVNIGDVGGIVYDEKTLSQDGACWLFRGNFNFPGARIGGDSIVDVGEAAPDVTGSANLDILGTSTVVGAPVKFTVGLGAVDGLVLSAADFEQGNLSYSAGTNWDTWKAGSASSVRLKAPIFMGGVAATLKLGVPGYTVQAYVLDRDGVGLTATAATNTGAGVTLAVPAGQYFTLRLAKNPTASIAPADATAAQIKFTGTYETKLVIVDSRLELNPANGSGIITIRPGGTYTVASGVKYPDSVIQNSKVVINSHMSTARMVRLLTELVNVSASIDATTADAQAVGIYRDVYNLAFTGNVTSNWNEAARSLIQAYDCDNFAVSSTIFPGLASAQTANTPFIFQGCNVPNGRFYHHAQIANTYKNIDFAKAQSDLGKAIASGEILASSEVEGMYRLYSTTGSLFGALAEAHDSVKSLNMTGGAATYGTTIYADAYLKGAFDFAGTNVFGNKVRSHPLARVLNVQPRVVQGNFSATSVGATIGAIVTIPQFVSTPIPFRVNGAKGLTVNNLPAGFVALLFLVDQNNVITRFGSGAEALPAEALTDMKAFVRFSKSDGSPITPADLAGVTVTVYNGCKIVNTGATAVNMKGNIRVEDNATLVNASVTGSGYFGSNSVASGLLIAGSVFMNDNAKFIKTAGTNVIRNLRVTENGSVNLGDVATLGVVQVADNAVLSPTGIGSVECDLFMGDNASLTSSVTISGVLRMKDDAKVNAGTLTTYGDITLCGSYNQTTAKGWTGKRVIDSQNAPTYDDNVKTQYDF